MKRLASLILTICMVMTLASCGNGSEPTPIELIPPIVSPVEIEQQEEVTHQEEVPKTSDDPFEGKIAIITDDPHGILSYSSAFPIIIQYGEEKIIHQRWPLIPTFARDEVTKIVEELRNDSNVKAIIANPSVHESVEGFERLREAREDIFLVFCISGSRELFEIADLILVVDEIGTGSAMVRQAQKMGAETFVYYVFERDDQPINIARRELIEQECDELGIRFIEVIIPDAIAWDIYERPKFLREDVQRIIQNYGKDTAFFSPSTLDLLWPVIYHGGIFPQPRDLFRSPFNAILGDIFDYFSMTGEDFIQIHLSAETSIELTREFLDEHDMLGRVSNWPVPYEFLFTHAATKYAIKRLNGEVTRDGIDVDVLRGIMEDFAGVNVYLTPFTDLETGITHEHVLMMRMGYFIY